MSALFNDCSPDWSYQSNLISQSSILLYASTFAASFHVQPPHFSMCGTAAPGDGGVPPASEILTATSPSFLLRWDWTTETHALSICSGSFTMRPLNVSGGGEKYTKKWLSLFYTYQLGRFSHILSNNQRNL